MRFKTDGNKEYNYHSGSSYKWWVFYEKRQSCRVGDAGFYCGVDTPHLVELVIPHICPS